MPGKVLFVDSENVPRLVLARIPTDIMVVMFFSTQHKTVPREYYTEARKRGDRCVDVEMQLGGKNALDFHIAYYIGVYLTRDATQECIVLSKDKGLDPLLAHLKHLGFKARRASDQAEVLGTPSKAASTTARTPSAPTKKVLPKPAAKKPAIETLADRVRKTWDMLSKTDPKKRPKKLKGLIAHVANYLKGIDALAVQQVVNEMIAAGRIKETGGKLEYTP